MSKISPGREREIRLIHQANRAAAVGRLMLGDLQTWQQFLEADTIDLENLPRRNIQAAAGDVKNRLSNEIRKFCSKNFREMNIAKLSLLYEDIKAYRGLELPLSEFETRYASVRKEVLIGCPAHATVRISLWGLQFKFPEDELAKDLISALHLILETHTQLNLYKAKSHREIVSIKEEIAVLVRRETFTARSILLCCFNLLEAYLNGLAWDYLHQVRNIQELSENKRKLLEDSNHTSISDKLYKYPEIISGRELWKKPDTNLDSIIKIFKPYRDSLVHPSPFSAPEKFGGYDKLRLFYRIEYDTAVTTSAILIHLIQEIHRHIHSNVEVPTWICNLETAIKATPLE